MTGGTSATWHAWMVLRGPWLLGYLMLFFGAVFTNPIFRSYLWWWPVMLVTSSILIVGSVSSYLVVREVEPRNLWLRLAAIETTGLRALILVQFAYASWRALTFPSEPLQGLLFHYFIAAVAVGALAERTWKVRARANG